MFKKRLKKPSETRHLIPFFNAQEKWPDVFLRCFNSPDGRRVLSYLQRHVIDKSLPPQINQQELYYHEGRRSLVLQIQSLIAQGLDKS